ncbi:MAG TPA: hypothetical protein VFI03_03620 [Solirubrobacterales bacterium]|nr:hypothetical protein [Solirubrobacterales bacterium]
MTFLGDVKGQLEQRPRWLVAAAALLIGSAVWVFFAEVPIGFKFFQLGFALVLSVFLLRGSRIAWGLTLVDPVWQIVELQGGGENWWAAAPLVVLVACLLAPASVRFVWLEAAQRPTPLFASRLPAPLERVFALSYAGLARVAQWEGGFRESDPGGAPRRYGVLAWRLGVASIVLLVLSGVVSSWEQGSARGNVVVDILGHVIRASWVIALLAFIAVLIVGAYSCLTRKRREVGSVPRT